MSKTIAPVLTAVMRKSGDDDLGEARAELWALKAVARAATELTIIQAAITLADRPRGIQLRHAEREHAFVGLHRSVCQLYNLSKGKKS